MFIKFVANSSQYRIDCVKKLCVQYDTVTRTEKRFCECRLDGSEVIRLYISLFCIAFNFIGLIEALRHASLDPLPCYKMPHPSDPARA